MDLLPTPEQTEIIDSSAAFVADQISIERTRELFEAGAVPAISESAWSAAADLGWLALGLPEDRNGVGCGLADEVLLFREIGRRLANGAIETAGAATFATSPRRAPRARRTASGAPGVFRDHPAGSRRAPPAGRTPPAAARLRSSRGSTSTTMRPTPSRDPPRTSCPPSRSRGPGSLLHPPGAGTAASCPRSASSPPSPAAGQRGRTPCRPRTPRPPSRTRRRCPRPRDPSPARVPAASTAPTAR